jgi:putative membrane protein
MNAKTWIGLTLGLGLLAGLIIWQGLADIAERIAGGGWAMLWVCAFAVPEAMLGAAAWRVLLIGKPLPPLRDLFVGAWIGTAVNNILPVAAIGGEVVRARLLILDGVAGAPAVASVVLDKTAQAMGVLFAALAGSVALARLAPSPASLTAALVGCGALSVGILGFIAIQYSGSFGFLARSVRRFAPGAPWTRVTTSAGEVDAAIRILYRAPARLLTAGLLRTAANLSLVGEVWLAAHLLGYPIGPAEALVLATLAAVIRGAAFAVPAGIGVQEGGFVMLGTLLDIPPDVALSLSFATRLRELVTGLMGILAWQRIEGRAWYARASLAPLRQDDRRS